MSYNNANHLDKVLEVQKIVLAKRQEGVTMKWIYKNLIYPRYYISYSTFNNYMTINTVLERTKKAATTVTAQNV
jgi:hypothetical protein